MNAYVAAAREWIGTPYQHQASMRGAGTDCLGLIRGVWRDVIGPEIAPIPPYTPNWADETGADTLLNAARSVLIEIDPADRSVGDVLGFRLRADAPVTHVGLLSQASHFIHAYGGRSVCESPFGSYWRRRSTHAFRFPFYS